MCDTRRITSEGIKFDYESIELEWSERYKRHLAWFGLSAVLTMLGQRNLWEY